MVDASTIATALRRPLDTVSDEDQAQWEQWIADAEMLLEFGDGVHKGLGDLTLLNPKQLAYVIREAVVAQVRRPDDATQIEVAVDDGRVSRRYETSKGRVTILPEWWAQLGPHQQPQGAFSVRPQFVPGSVICP